MITLSNAVAVAILDFINGKFTEGTVGNPTLVLYAGPRPAVPETAVPIQARALITFPLPITDLFADASSEPGGGIAGANVELIPETTIVQSGEAEWFRAFNRNGIAVMDGSVSNTAGNGDCKLLQTSLAAGKKVTIAEWIARYPQ